MASKTTCERGAPYVFYYRRARKRANPMPTKVKSAADLLCVVNEFARADLLPGPKCFLSWAGTESIELFRAATSPSRPAGQQHVRAHFGRPQVRARSGRAATGTHHLSGQMRWLDMICDNAHRWSDGTKQPERFSVSASDSHPRTSRYSEPTLLKID